MADILPGMCVATDCGRRGEGLIERYEPHDTAEGLTVSDPTGEWIWLCGRHLVEEFS